MLAKYLFIISVLILSLNACQTTQSAQSLSALSPQPPFLKNKNDYQEYLTYFDEVYATMDANYYQPISKDLYNNFI